MLQLYYDPYCSYCQRVLSYLDREDIPFQKKEISLRGDSSIRKELIAHGGKSQVPYLIDTDRNVSMYESSAIVDYLVEHYS